MCCNNCCFGALAAAALTNSRCACYGYQQSNYNGCGAANACFNNCGSPAVYNGCGGNNGIAYANAGAGYNYNLVIPANITPSCRSYINPYTGCQVRY